MLNAGLGTAGFELLRCGESDYVKPFLPFRKTLGGARKAGLSAGDYIDLKHQLPGATQATVGRMAELGVFSPKINNVCEIGPGSGRYLKKVLRLCAPCSYEIYETAREWSDWLVRTYPVRAHEADGRTLSQTADGSVDLVHAHKVFVYLQVVVTCRYFSEMIRVARPGGRIVFDIFSEPCMADAEMEKWAASGSYFPNMIARDFAIGFFARRGCSLTSRFFAPMKPGESEYLVFVKGA
jgi:SAM-dependent methyltransferase